MAARSLLPTRVTWSRSPSGDADTHFRGEADGERAPYLTKFVSRSRDEGYAQSPNGVLADSLRHSAGGLYSKRRRLRRCRPEEDTHSMRPRGVGCEDADRSWGGAGGSYSVPCYSGAALRTSSSGGVQPECGAAT